MDTDFKLRDIERKLERLNDLLEENTKETRKLEDKMRILKSEESKLSQERVRLTGEIAREEQAKNQRLQEIQKELERDQKKK
jgi:peptidoglycan hydrolase CwlO-like protein